MVWVKSKSVVKLIQPPEPVASTFLLVCTFAKAGMKEKREIQIETVGHSVVVTGTLESGRPKFTFWLCHVSVT